MKVRSPSFLYLAATIVAIVYSLMAWNHRGLHRKHIAAHATSPALVRNSQRDFSKVSPVILSSNSGGLLSEEELQEFPEAVVLESAEVEGPQAGQKTKIHLLKTNFKYPFIRTEEITDTATGAVIDREEMVASHFLARLSKGEDPSLFLKKFGDQAFSIERVVHDLYRVNLSSSSLTALPQALVTAGDTSALYSEPDFIARAENRPNDPFFFKEQWYLLRSYGLINEDESKRFSGINAEDAWDVRTSAASIIVAVIDTGVRYTHEDLAANMWENSVPTYGDIHGMNAFDRDKKGNLTGDPMDNSHHGTHCAGIIGAVGDNGLGITGIAWKVQLMACKWLGRSSPGAIDTGVSSDAIACIDYAVQHGARILNCSWSVPESMGLLEVMKEAREAGVIVVAAAGNQHINLDERPRYPSGYLLDNIVTVTAFGENNELASFSNYGPKTVALAAPGVNIYSTWNDSDNSYNNDTGTSMAAACVSGSLALLEKEYPLESYQELIQRLLVTTDKTPSLSEHVQTGRLNLARAMKEPVQSEKDPQNTWWNWWENLWPAKGSF